MTLLETALEGLPKRQGKVRDVYDLGDRLLMIATDRISAYDWVMPNGIPDKGRILTGVSMFWFNQLAVSNHVLSTDVRDAGLNLSSETIEALTGRSMIVKKAAVIPFECVVRGYLSGSGWREYRQSGTVCNERLPEGLVESSKLDRSYFTPATKAESGHDENVPYSVLVDALGTSEAETLRDRSIALYEKAGAQALAQGLILADTKFEWGHDRETGELLLIDEVLTPDSSRYWSTATYRPGGPQPSFDKQFVRDWLDASGWDKSSPPPTLPDDVVAKTREKYVDAYETLTGQAFPWK
ncbi:phosphoribosylaminoimidazolesuccinocarboxamide synthase [Singulisphaera acidiphila]|uniref:Phosphoribosylaminoimidazole-succinocarboxamide synthase n=1 Tax=Singulisphaera acidiphila (strain ATCC BAA-1392 / DSM 18658 / VKM B-2454 / MOB10) TaxID=886293 RepID=L0DMM9_SINAD|nr:phosphoribosylaminoimidazolesuccinocarboxamide synthase [Singulisphaera acidiphila]AGA30080.1 phosphoribosylaminoimidazole-succinocarboxamide synthase [Singulisphaera acidiphila DSM 18658]